MLINQILGNYYIKISVTGLLIFLAIYMIAEVFSANKLFNTKHKKIIKQCLDLIINPILLLMIGYILHAGWTAIHSYLAVSNSFKHHFSFYLLYFTEFAAVYWLCANIFSWGNKKIKRWTGELQHALLIILIPILVDTIESAIMFAKVKIFIPVLQIDKFLGVMPRDVRLILFSFVICMMFYKITKIINKFLNDKKILNSQSFYIRNYHKFKINNPSNSDENMKKILSILNALCMRQLLKNK